MRDHDILIIESISSVPYVIAIKVVFIEGETIMAEETHKEAGPQIIEFWNGLFFSIRQIDNESVRDKCNRVTDVLEHWHPEVEIIYTLAGHAQHYIDGQVYTARPGSLFVVNSQSIHKVISDPEAFDCADVVAVVVHVKYEILKLLIPDMEDKYFAAEIEDGTGEVGVLFENVIRLRKEKGVNLTYDHFLINSWLNKLLYLVCRNGLREKNSILTIGNKKNADTLRNILEFVSAHYREPIQQMEVARMFFFTKESFARFFRNNTGIPFGKYLRLYRVEMARKELLESDKLIIDIAEDNGFADVRGFINAFKSVYGISPLQYRRQNKD